MGLKARFFRLLCAAGALSGGFSHLSATILQAPPVSRVADSARYAKNYSGLVFYKEDTLASRYGIKSVLFNLSGTKLYAMNLEDMSIFEFDRAEKNLNRVFRFQASPAPGWDYRLNTPMPSFEEKPVEACFTHDDRMLWVSLHNAGGIVAIRLDSPAVRLNKNFPRKRIYVNKTGKDSADTVDAPLIKTGRTPKVIAATADNKYLLVSNWHAKSISVLRINDSIPPYGKVVANIPVKDTPRGIAVDDLKKRSYVAIWGGNQIRVINNRSWKNERTIAVADNPRHIVLDKQGRLFVSFSQPGVIACIDGRNGRTLFKASTGAQPRTIALSKNQRFLFVTCYEGNTLDVFRINKNSFTRIYSIGCPGKPVGIDLYEDDEQLEAWVCDYLSGKLKVFSFKKL